MCEDIFVIKNGTGESLKTILVLLRQAEVYKEGLKLLPFTSLLGNVKRDHE